MSVTRVTVSPLNKRYKYLDSVKKIIIGKSKIDEEDYDDIVFACRIVSHVSIPSFIKRISSYAFSSCKIETLKYEVKSNLTSIGVKAFFLSSMKNFFITESVVDLADSWCGGIWNYLKVSLSDKNPNYKFLDDKMIVGKSDPKSDVFDVLVYVLPDIVNATIPSTIKRINSYAFFRCNKLESVKFDENSKLELINQFAFLRNSYFQFQNMHFVQQVSNILRFSQKLRKL